MIKDTFYGYSIDILENLTELKNIFRYGDYFKGFETKKQMFKFFLGKDIFIDENRTKKEKPIDAIDFPCRGRYVRISPMGEDDSCDVCIEFYKASDLTPDSELVEDLDWLDPIFIQDDAGKLWIIKIDED